MNSGVIHGCEGDSVRTVCDSFMMLWCLFTQTLGCAFIALHTELVFVIQSECGSE